MLLTIITFLIILSILVIVHEGGHFFAARAVGVKVEEFALGLPFTKPIFSKVRKGGLRVSLYPILFGGFVKLKGEDATETTKDKDSFQNKNPWQRAFIILAGVTMNFILAFVVISYAFTQGVALPATKITVTSVASNSPAELAMIIKDDVITAVDNQTVTSIEQFTTYIKAHLGSEISLAVKRGNENLTVKVLARKDPPAGEGAIGITFEPYEIVKYPMWEAPGRGLKETFSLSFLMFSELGKMIGNIFTTHTVPADISGPVGIAQITGDSIKEGIQSVVRLLGFLSLNLAVINVLPFPALDGGRLVFIVIEGIFGKKAKPKLENAIHSAGMAFLLILIVLISIGDVNRILKTTSIGQRIMSVFQQK